MLNKNAFSFCSTLQTILIYLLVIDPPEKRAYGDSENMVMVLGIWYSFIR